MRTIIPVLLLLALYGCRQQSTHDPYLEAINQYNSSLITAQAHNTPIDPPPKPVYLECPMQPGAPPEFGGAQTVSQGECERTNMARKDAYEDAMQRYEKIVTGRSSILH